MLNGARVGDLVRLQYREEIQRCFPLQGRVGVVVIASRGKPRNHGVRINGKVYVTPAGHLVKLGSLAALFDWRDAR